MPDPKVNVQIDANTAPFANGIKRVVAMVNGELKGAFSDVSSQIAAMFGTMAVWQGFKRLIEYSSRFADAAGKLGVGVEWLQATTNAAAETGAAMGDVETAIKQIQLSMATALGGNADEIAAFERLGVSLADLKRMNVEQVFDAIARKLGSSAVTAQTMADAIRIMGRGGDALLGPMKNGLVEVASELSKILSLSKGTIAVWDEMGDSMQRWIGRTIKFASEGVVNLADAINAIIDGRRSLEGIRSYMATSRGLREAAAAQAEKRNRALASRAPAMSMEELGKLSKERDAGLAQMSQDMRAPLGFQQDALARMGLFVGSGPTSGVLGLAAQQKRTNAELAAIRAKVDALIGEVKGAL
jgi:hypothetical protein